MIASQRRLTVNPCGMRWGAMISLAGCALLAVLPAGGLAAAGVDYAESRHAGLCLQQPVYGGPSFDAFVHAPHNPLHRGAPPRYGV